MSRVYHALDRLTGEAVAYKQLLFEEDIPRTAEDHLVLVREFQILASLRHPHIVSVLDFGFTAAHEPFYTMTCLPAPQTIVAAAQGQPLTVQVALLTQMLQALAYLHRRQIVHCDLKPNNVLVAQDRVYVVDFGLALAVGQKGELAGTLPYMAPELLQHQPPSPAADLYAAGVLAVELLTGQLPLTATSVEKWFHAILHAPPDLSRVAEPLRPVLARLLAKQPAERYPSANAALAYLNAALGLPLPAETATLRESFLQAADFVGRETELAQLLTALPAAQAGQQAGWLIGGESGVGKSRLMNELRNQALVQGWVCLRGQLVSAGGQPYQLWLDIFRWLAVLAATDDLALSVLKPFVPDLERLLKTQIPAAPELDPQPTQVRLFATVVSLLERAAAAQPLVLLLEDLQWIGPNSLALLQHLLNHKGPWSVCILASYRDDETPHLPTQLPQLPLLPLKRLALPAITALSRSMLGVQGARPDVVRFLERESEGNVFFLMEVVRALAEKAGDLELIGVITLPAHIFAGGIRQIVQQRLARLPAASAPVFQLAAVLGRQLDLPLLAAAYPATDWELWLLAGAEAAVLEVQANIWRFAHDKLREGLLADLSPAESAALHRQAAELIERVYGPAAPAATLAHHWAAAQVPEREGHYAALAGAQAAACFANAEALTFLTRALQLTPPTALEQRYHLLSQRETVYALLVQRAEQAQDIAALEALANELGNPAYQFAVAIRQVDYHISLEAIATALTAAEAAWQYATAAQSPVLQAEALSALGWVCFRQRKPAEAKEHLAQALALAQHSAAVELEIQISQKLGNVQRATGDFVKAQDLYTHALQLAQAQHNRRGELRALHGLGLVAISRHHLTAARQYLQQVRQMAHAIGERNMETLALANLSGTALRQGDYANAHQYARQGWQAARIMLAPRLEGHALINLGLALGRLGEVTAGVVHLAQAVKVASRVDDVLVLGHAYLRGGWLLLTAQQAAAAQPQFEQALATFNALKATPLAAECQAGLAGSAWQQHDLPTAINWALAAVAIWEQPQAGDTDEPLLAQWMCYQVLQAGQHPQAAAVLARAQAELQKQAALLDEASRQTFLMNIAHHRALNAARHNG